LPASRASLWRFGKCCGYLRVWTALGVPAFIALIVVFWLMVAKPV
jgi:uncharacterized membrane protein